MSKRLNKCWFKKQTLYDHQVVTTKGSTSKAKSLTIWPQCTWSEIFGWPRNHIHDIWAHSQIYNWGNLHTNWCCNSHKFSLAIGALHWNIEWQSKIINEKIDLTYLCSKSWNRLSYVEEEKTTFHHHIDITYQIARKWSPLLRRLYHTCILVSYVYDTTPWRKMLNFETSR